MSNQVIKAPNWLKHDLQVYNRHFEMAGKIGQRIGQYLERIGYETDTDWGGRYQLAIVTGEANEKDGKEYLEVEGFPRAKPNGDGVYVHQVCQMEDSYSGEIYIPCGDGEYIQVHFWC